MMTNIQCKVCGQNIEHNEDRAYGSCPHCGSAMTLPRGADAERIRLFNQANTLRLAGEYDQAEAICDRLLAADNTDSEAHWYRVLCRYGVLYVKEDSRGEYVLTCRRNMPKSVLNDANCHMAIWLATDAFIREQYERETERIEAAQNAIRAGLSQQTLPESTEDKAESSQLFSRQNTTGTLEGQAAFVPSAASLIRRAQLFLEDGDYGSAVDYADKVLDVHPEYAPAYMVRLQSKLRVRYEHELGEGKESLEHDADYQKALRFADPAQKQVYQGYNERIMKRLESNHKENAYKAALRQVQSARSEEEYRKAAEAFRALAGYRDAGSQEEQTLMKAEEARLNKSRQDDEKGKKRQKGKKPLVVILVVLLLTGIVAALWITQVFLPQRAYLNAYALLNSKQYDLAANAFAALGNYSDSAMMARESIYQKGMLLRENRQFREAILEFRKITGYNDADVIAAELQFIIERMNAYKLQWNAGNVVTFGAYEQDNNTGNGAEAVKWRILQRRGNSALLLSEYNLACLPYNDVVKPDSLWLNSSLREWLNNVFLKSAFSDKEMTALIPPVIDGDGSMGVEAGFQTRDKVFILSESEARALLPDDESRVARNTRYAAEQGAYTVPNGSIGMWWLRAEGDHRIPYVFTDGNIIATSIEYINDTIAVRPAIWVDVLLHLDATQTD